MVVEEFGSRSYFRAADYAVCGGLIAGSLAIGVYYGLRGGGQRTSSAYLLADRSMGAVPVALSLLSSLFSSIALQGFPADVYYHGASIVWMGPPIASGGALALLFYMRMYHRIGMASAYEYLEMRFNYAVKICGVISFLVFAVLYSGLVGHLAGAAATAVTGVNQVVTLIFLLVVCSIYTVIGGIKAVVWADTLQMLLMIATAVAIIIKVAAGMGFVELWAIASAGSRTNFFDFSSDLTDFYNGWGFLFQLQLGGMFITSQYMVQRLVVCRSEAVARGAVICYSVGSILFMILVTVTGICLYAHYAGCDPTTLGYITKKDQIVPFFIVDAFDDLPGVAGLLLTGLFSSTFSTLSSVLNATATVIGEHFLKPYWKGLTDVRYTMTLKVIVVGASAVAFGVALLVPLVGSAVPMVLTITGCSFGSLLALYVLGAFFPVCGSKGAIVGFVVGMAVSITMSVGCMVFQSPPGTLPLSAHMCLNDTSNATFAESMTTGPLWNQTVPLEMIVRDSGIESGNVPVMFTLAKNWLSLVSIITTMCAALLATLITGKADMSHMDPRLVFWKFKSEFTQPDQEMKEMTEYTETNSNDDIPTG